MVTNNEIDLTAQGVVYYNGTGTFSGIDGSTAGRVLTSNGTGVAPSFQAVASGGGMNGFVTTGIAGNNPADATTYYFNQTWSFQTTNANGMKFYANQAVTITSVYGAIRVSGTLGSAQNITIFARKNDTTNTNITTTAVATATDNAFSNNALSISLAAGDYIVFGMTTPTWTTNPTTVNIAIGFST